jgi:putative tricarboxylic transport membrane protein
MWLAGFAAAFSGTNLLFLFLGAIYGMIVGALPGLGGMFAVALALPMTFTMPVDTAIIFWRQFTLPALMERPLPPS